MNYSKVFVLFSILFLSVPVAVQADSVDNTNTPALERPVYGMYEELYRIPDYITNVRCDEESRVWIMLGPLAQNKELKIRLRSTENGPLRRWEDGSDSLTADAYRGTTTNIWSDWVRVSASYIEYWVDDQLVLKLHRLN